MSKLVRRSHMYLALFLSPWLIMYAASTFVMNHRAWFHPVPASPPPFEKESEQTFRGQLPENAAPREIAIALLRDLDLEGAHSVNASPDKQRITIVRQEAASARRLIFTPTDNRVIIEKQ